MKKNNAQIKNISRMVCGILLSAACVASVTAQPGRPQGPRQGPGQRGHRPGDIEATRPAPEEIAARMQDGLFSRYDANEDGVITAEEAWIQHEDRVADLIDRLVNAAETDGRPRPHHPERPRGHGPQAKGPGPRGALVEDYDANGDGVLSTEEWVAAGEGLLRDAHTRFMEHFDLNQDGLITTEEAQAVHEAMVAERLAQAEERLSTRESRLEDRNERASRGPGRERPSRR